MDGIEYKELIESEPNVPLVRPHWEEKEYHKSIWLDKDVTVLICQRKTRDITRLCLDSLLNFYPDIPVLVVDGYSKDESADYLAVKKTLYDNVRVWTRDGINSHGLTMHDAILSRIHTKYVLLMDSDIVTLRGGWVEDMIDHLDSDSNTYAIGSLMLVSARNDACGVPDNKEDVLRYAHPSCSLYRVDMYKGLARFVDHGAPCCYNNQDAALKGYDIVNYPVDKYVAHLSGASWTDPKTIWAHDNNVIVRPLVTFIGIPESIFAEQQTVRWFDVVPYGETKKESVVIHGEAPIVVENNLADMRFSVLGEYVCEITGRITKTFVEELIESITSTKGADVIDVQGYEVIKRKVWQRKNALK